MFFLESKVENKELTEQKMLEYLYEKNPDANKKLPSFFLSVGEEYGINGLYGFVFSDFVTNHFQFNRKNKQKFNFLYLKNPDGSLVSFNNVEEGVKKVFEYLSYFVNENVIVDEKIQKFLVKLHSNIEQVKGKCKTVEALDIALEEPVFDKTKYADYQQARKNEDTIAFQLIKTIQYIDSLNVKNESVEIEKEDIKEEIKNEPVKTVEDKSRIVENVADSTTEEAKYYVAYPKVMSDSKELSFYVKKFASVPFMFTKYKTGYLAVFSNSDTYEEAVKKKVNLLKKGIKATVFE